MCQQTVTKKKKIKFNVPPSASQISRTVECSLNGPIVPSSFWPSESTIKTRLGGTIVGHRSMFVSVQNYCLWIWSIDERGRIERKESEKIYFNKKNKFKEGLALWRRGEQTVKLVWTSATGTAKWSQQTSLLAHWILGKDCVAFEFCRLQ